MTVHVVEKDQWCAHLSAIRHFKSKECSPFFHFWWWTFRCRVKGIRTLPTFSLCSSSKYCSLHPWEMLERTLQDTTLSTSKTSCLSHKVAARLHTFTKLSDSSLPFLPYKNTRNLTSVMPTKVNRKEDTNPLTNQQSFLHCTKHHQSHLEITTLTTGDGISKRKLHKHEASFTLHTDTYLARTRSEWHPGTHVLTAMAASLSRRHFDGTVTWAMLAQNVIEILGTVCTYM